MVLSKEKPLVEQDLVLDQITPCTKEQLSDVEDSSKPHLQPGTEPFSPEEKFLEVLNDYYSYKDSDYKPSNSEESSKDELEYNSDASEDWSEEEISGDAEI